MAFIGHAAFRPPEPKQPLHFTAAAEKFAMAKIKESKKGVASFAGETNLTDMVEMSWEDLVAVAPKSATQAELDNAVVMAGWGTKVSTIKAFRRNGKRHSLLLSQWESIPFSIRKWITKAREEQEPKATKKKRIKKAFTEEESMEVAKNLNRSADGNGLLCFVFVCTIFAEECAVKIHMCIST
jgi:hypothetical protein